MSAPRECDRDRERDERPGERLTAAADGSMRRAPGGPSSREGSSPARSDENVVLFSWTHECLTSPALMVLLPAVLLCALGLVMVFSASSSGLFLDEVLNGEPVASGVSAAWGTVLRQFAIMAVAAVICRLVATKFDAGILVSDAWPKFYLFLVAVLILVFVPGIGVELNGARRWVSVGITTIQPSEFMKIVLVMVMARYLARWERNEISTFACVVQFVALMLIPLVLVYLQHDLGTLLIACAALYCVGLLGGMRKTYLVPVLVLGLFLGTCLILFVGYRSSRLSAWLDPFNDSSDAGWQLVRGLFAFADGGFWGRGIGNSVEKYGYLTQADSDFVFAVIGEELGFVGCFAVVLLFMVFTIGGLRISFQARDRSLGESLLAGGLTAAIAVQAIINMGGTTGTLPLSGRPLPFVSAGGTSILVSLLIVGILLSIARNNKRYARGRASVSRQRNLRVFDGGTAAEREGAR